MMCAHNFPFTADWGQVTLSCIKSSFSVCVFFFFLQTFAESTMNELLGWYGYDKVDLRESEANEIRNYRERRQHVSVLKGEEGRCKLLIRS